MFHRNNTYGEILSVPEFADVKDYLFYENSAALMQFSKGARIFEKQGQLQKKQENRI